MWQYLMTKDMEKAETLHIFFASLFTGLTDFQASQMSEADWSTDDWSSVEKDQVWEHLNKLNKVHGSWWDPPMRPEGNGACESIYSLHNLWKVIATSRGPWELAERKHCSYLQEGQVGGSEELLSSQPHLSPWRGDRASNPGNSFQTLEGKECSWM